VGHPAGGWWWSNSAPLTTAAVPAGLPVRRLLTRVSGTFLWAAYTFHGGITITPGGGKKKRGFGVDPRFSTVFHGYAVNGGTLKTLVALPGTSVAMNSDVRHFNPQLIFILEIWPIRFAAGPITMAEP